MTNPSPDTLAAALDAMGLPASREDAERLAAEIGRHGDLDRLALALAHDEAWRLLDLLGAWRAHRDEQREPALRLARLHREADALDRRAEPAWAEAADLHGRAAARRLRGESDLAGSFERQAEAAETFASGLQAEAFAKRLQAARLEAGVELRGVMAHVLAA